MNKTKKNQGGRPSKYKPAFNQQAYKLCLLGATDKELADFFEVSVRVLNYWKKEYPGFLHSIKGGKVQADAVVAEKLFKRATGYSHPDEQIFIYYGKPVIVKTKKHYAPDTTAAIFWLKNRAKETWRDKQDLSLEFDKLSDDQVEDLFKKIITKVNETENDAGKKRVS